MEHMSTARAVVAMGRFHFLLSGLLLYGLGALFALAAGAAPASSQVLWGYVVLMFGHLSVSYSNDYFDYETDKKGMQTPFSGGSGTLQRMPGLRPLALRIAWGLIACSVLLGTAFVWHFGFSPAFILAIIGGNLLGYYYSAPPLSLSYRGWGEPATTAATGIVVPGMGYVCAGGGWSPVLAALLLPAVCYGLAFILTVELPDREEDSAGGKQTLVVKKGRDAAARIILAACITATALTGFMTLAGWFPAGIKSAVVILLSCIPLVAAAHAIRQHPLSKPMSHRIVVTNMSAIIGYVLLFDLYLLSLMV